MTQSAGLIYSFGDYELDTRLHELRRADERLHIEPQVFDVLAHLFQHDIHHRGQVRRVHADPQHHNKKTPARGRAGVRTNTSSEAIGLTDR